MDFNDELKYLTGVLGVDVVSKNVLNFIHLYSLC